MTAQYPDQETALSQQGLHIQKISKFLIRKLRIKNWLALLDVIM
jgi:hypothetical protein